MEKLLRRGNILALTISICMASFSLRSLAQNITKISGKVYDVETREPLPFVNVIVKGTKVGTSTDFEGNYSVSTAELADSIFAVYIGYLKATKGIKRGITQTINIALKPNAIALQAVEIKPGENPAHRILRQVIKHKDDNNRTKLEAYQYEVYNKIEFDLNNISKEYKNNILFKPFSFVFDAIDSSNVKEKPQLPIFMTESLSDYYYKRNPKFKKEVIRASKVAGVESPSVSQFMGEMYQQVNVYDNTILVFGKNFISPISDNGLLFYRYYLIDSLFLGNKWCYHLQFKPKRRQELTFEGNMWVADSSFAVKRLEMSIADDANINFVHMLNVIQEYDEVDKGWLLSKEKLVIDFALREKKMGIYGRKTSSYKNIHVNQPQPDEFYSKTDNLIVNEDADKKTEDYWKTVRHDTLSKNEQKIYKLVDTIQGLPVYRTWQDIVTLFVTGYRVIGPIEFGPYYNTFSFNAVEGNRFRIGGRTSDHFSTSKELKGYVAYGTLDERFKYSIGGKAFISKKPRQIVGLYYKDDLEIFGQSQNAFTTDNILASLLRRSPLSKLTKVQQVQSYYEHEWFNGLNSKLTFINRKMSPEGTLKYEYLKSDSTIGQQNNIITSEIRLMTRLAYDERYLAGQSGFTRISLGTKYPVIQVQYTLGARKIFNSDYKYHKINFNLSDRIRINPIGYFDYTLEYGKVVGDVPFPLLELHGGNETDVYDPYAFNTMNYYEFASDEYFTAQIFHHFDGLFLNKIPLLRKLKWREVITGKALIGRVSHTNQSILIFPKTLSQLDSGGGPYYEASAGIENIFKIFRIDVLWRLSYIDKNYTDRYYSNGGNRIAKFGIRGSMQVIF